jgi:hypothetical protein
MCSGFDGIRHNGVLNAAYALCDELEATMHGIITNANTFSAFDSPCHLPSRSLSTGERLGQVLGPRLQHRPGRNLGVPGYGAPSTSHPSLPPGPPGAAEDRVQRMVLQSLHFTCEMALVTPVGRRGPDKADQQLRGDPDLSVGIGSRPGSIGPSRIPLPLFLLEQGGHT